MLIYGVPVQYKLHQNINGLFICRIPKYLKFLQLRNELIKMCAVYISSMNQA